MTNINTISDLMNQAAEAALEGDLEKLHDLAAVSSGWLQSEDECQAQQAMISAFIELAERADF